MRLVHLAEEEALERANEWLPYLFRIAEREGRHYEAFLQEIVTGQVRLFLIEHNGVKGACTTRIVILNETELVGELHWLAGDDIKEWFAEFVPAVEKTFAGIARFQITGRRGFARLLKPHGYNLHKVILEKRP